MIVNAKKKIAQKSSSNKALKWFVEPSNKSKGNNTFYFIAGWHKDTGKQDGLQWR